MFYNILRKMVLIAVIILFSHNLVAQGVTQDIHVVQAFIKQLVHQGYDHDEILEHAYHQEWDEEKIQLLEALLEKLEQEEQVCPEKNNNFLWFTAGALATGVCLYFLIKYLRKNNTLGSPGNPGNNEKEGDDQRVPIITMKPVDENIVLSQNDKTWINSIIHGNTGSRHDRIDTVRQRYPDIEFDYEEQTAKPAPMQGFYFSGQQWPTWNSQQKNA